MELFTGSFTGYGTSIVYPYIEYSYTQSSAGNYSDITMKVYFRLVNASYYFFNTVNHSCTSNINGTTSTDTDADYTLNSSNTLELVKTQTTRVYHNSDGTKTCYIGTSGNTNTVLGTYNFGQNVVLNPITRAPAVTSTAASSVGETSATVGGTVTDVGIPASTDRGVYWGTSSGSQPNRVSSGSGAGAFTANITGLSGGTTYYFKAYSYNSSHGYSYGGVLNFTTTSNVPDVTTTAASSVTYNSASSGGNVTSDHGAAVTARGVCYNTTGNPTISDSTVSSGTGTGSFTSNLTGLLPLTTYYIRAYATNSVGTSYGAQRTFTTLAATPTVTTTSPVSSITTTTATFDGEVVSDNGATITQRGFVYSVAPNPTTSDSKLVASGTTGVMSSGATGLVSATTYHVRAFATNSYGTSYGTDVEFETLPTDPTALTATAVSKTSINVAWTKGTGDYTIIRRGTTWPANINSGTLVYNGTGSSFTDTGLTQGTEYFYRAWSGTEAHGSGTYSNSYAQVSETTVSDFTNPGNALLDDSNYAEVITSAGGLKCQVSQDGGSTWSVSKSITATASPTAVSFGSGSTELWGFTWTGSDMDDGNFAVKLTGDSGESFQIYGTFGFSIANTYTLTGVQVEVKVAYASPNFYLYYVKVNPNYGTSPLPIGAGSLAYDTTLKLPTYYNDSDWVPVSPMSHEHVIGDVADITATADEINVLDGVTATTTEINALSVLDSDSLQVYIGQLMYPVGSIYINATDNTNPATLLGFGTWTAFGSGRVPVGYNSGDTDFNAGEKTGGSKTVNLQHSHTQGTLKAAIGAVNGDSAALGYQPTSAISGVSYNNNYGVDGTGPGTISSVNHATPVYGSTANSGSTTQTIVQPYITVYMWKRTA